jgi:hypothetical protein
MKRIVRAFSLASLVGCSILSSVDCGSSGDAVLADGVTIVTQSAVDQVKVEPGRLVFPATGSDDILQKKPGDILVGDRSETNAQNPFGFLRKVKSVSKTDAGIVVETEQALITDAVRDGKFQATLETPGLGAGGPLPSTPRSEPQDTGSSVKLLDFAGKSIFDESGSIDIGGATPQSVTFHASAKTTKGSVTFTPSWDIGADIGFFKVKEFHAIATGELAAEVEIDALLETSTTLDSEAVAKLIAEKIAKSTNTTLWEYPITLGTVHIGPLPIPISANFKTTLECDFAYGGKVEIVIGAQGSTKVTAGLKYEGEQLSPVFGHGAAYGVTGPAWTLGGAIKLRCDVKPRFDLKFYDLASAGISADAYASIYGAAQCGAEGLTGKVEGEAHAGATASVYAKADIFGLIKFDEACTLFDIESPHAQTSAQFSLPGGAGGTCTSEPVPPNEPRGEANPEACFGRDSASTGSGSGASTGGAGSTGASGGTCGKNLTAPAIWTCAAEKYGDCACDCGCGIQDDDCLAGECASCAHDVCTVGAALGRECSACAKAVCDKDPYCCEEQWGASCLLSVQDLCGMKCP